ncbi:hypothetical protein BCR39DRAFT_556490 [Naematelia encephala]|uniref:Uncharacterized protein n=1 Tax=Naematelia encephala TaxID=71784 RepID=A0A1Y2BJN7_9TREE|nr:hypothetical protein BCR39DRAFT_556490 [Naematelia encephala]
MVGKARDEITQLQGWGDRFKNFKEIRKLTIETEYLAPATGGQDSIIAQLASRIQSLDNITVTGISKYDDSTTFFPHLDNSTLPVSLRSLILKMDDTLGLNVYQTLHGLSKHDSWTRDLQVELHCSQEPFTWNETVHLPFGWFWQKSVSKGGQDTDGTSQGSLQMVFVTRNSTESTEILSKYSEIAGVHSDTAHEAFLQLWKNRRWPEPPSSYRQVLTDFQEQDGSTYNQYESNVVG